MNRKLLPSIYGVFAFLILTILPGTVLAVSYDVNIIATVPGCGDEIIGTGEECDGSNQGGASCSSLGFASGPLSCSSVCTRITSACVAATPDGGGSVRSDYSYPDLPNTNIVVSGYSEPYARVQLLKDGQLTATAIANEGGHFQLTISGLNEGTYLMQLVSVSSLRIFARGETFPLRVVSGLTTRVSDVLLPPAVLVDETLTGVVFRGRAIPNTSIVMRIFNASTTIERLITTDNNGDFVSTIDNAQLPASLYQAELRLSFRGFEVITTIPKFQTNNLVNAGQNCLLTYDLSADCALNVVDFILARRYYQFSPTVLLFDYNNDGKQDLKDFSIMAYYWTG